MKVERRKIAELKNDPANARKHSPRNLKAIRDSLDVFGQQKPIVVDSRGVVIAGNGTLEAARELGWDDIAVAVTDLDPEMRAKVSPLAKPYPKRVGGVDSDTPAIHAGEGGASPTSTLHINEL